MLLLFLLVLMLMLVVVMWFHEERDADAHAAPVLLLHSWTGPFSSASRSSCATTHSPPADDDSWQQMVGRHCCCRFLRGLWGWSGWRDCHWSQYSHAGLVVAVASVATVISKDYVHYRCPPGMTMTMVMYASSASLFVALLSMETVDCLVPIPPRF